MVIICIGCDAFALARQPSGEIATGRKPSRRMPRRRLKSHNRGFGEAPPAPNTLTLRPGAVRPRPIYSYKSASRESLMTRMGRFMEIECEMALALMVGLVPIDDVQHRSDGKIAGRKRCGDFLKPIVAVVGQRR